MSFVCPSCGEKLNRNENRLVCSRNHSFDRAKEGYFNLLLSSGGMHGDNKEMVNARQSFLSAGFYRRLADRLSETVLSVTRTRGVVLDSGSGEGYYTDIVERSLCERDGEGDVYAFDISKDAVKSAAKKNKRIKYVVASAYRQPFSSETFDTVYNVFSPLALDEVKRVLKPNGSFIMVIPDEYHLFELKEKIYDTPYKNKVEDTRLEGFDLLSDEPLRYTMDLKTNNDVVSLFKMTPYAYRTKKEDANKVISLSDLKVSANFRILTYRKA